MAKKFFILSGVLVAFPVLATESKVPHAATPPENKSSTAKAPEATAPSGISLEKKIQLETPNKKAKTPGQDALIFMGDASGSCPAFRFAFSSEPVEKEQAEKFCEKLDAKDDRSKSNLYWGVADRIQFDHIKFKCGFSQVASRNPQLSGLFRGPNQELRKVWHDYPPAGNGPQVPPIADITFNEKPEVPKMINGHPVYTSLKKLPVICVLYRAQI